MILSNILLNLKLTVLELIMAVQGRYSTLNASFHVDI